MPQPTIPVVSPSMPPYEEYLQEIQSLWESRWLTHTGPKHRQLQQALCQYMQLEHLELFANGHLALELGLLALGLTGEVITTPFTFASTTQAIVRCGLQPVFCDIRPDDYTIDADKIEALITERTSAILPVHVYGNLCQVDKIEAIARKYGLKVIYDAAHAFGIRQGGKGVGNFGDMSMFSFHATKVFHTVEGGGLAFRDPALHERLAELRQFGMQGQEAVPLVGTNAKMTEMHAAMGLCNLRHVDEYIARRKAAVRRYQERLRNIAGLKPCTEAEDVQGNYAYFPVLVEGYVCSRDQLADRLAAHGIFARKYFYPITSSFACYQGRFPIQDTPVAQWVSDRILCLPLYSDLSLDTVDSICDLLAP